MVQTVLAVQVRNCVTGTILGMASRVEGRRKATENMLHPSPLQDTIAAIATPPGRGGIGVVRFSGPLALKIAEPLFRFGRPLAPGQARYAELLDPVSLREKRTPAVLDQAVVTFFQAPNSYTSEDVIEISLHGSPVLLDTVLRYALANGARLAEPGEFTQRAFLSGRLDLTRAEAVRDLIDSSTLHQARVAAAQLGGSISKAIAPIKRQLVTLIAGLEAGIDFAEDDLDAVSADDTSGAIEQILAPLHALSKTFERGRAVKEGLIVALAGQPNVGKSSLFNRLLGRNRAIVTAQPGTTRDPIAERLAVAGIPVEMIDTAGLRDLSDEAKHEAERAGIDRTRSSIAEAHHVLLIVDGTAAVLTSPALPTLDAETLASLSGRPATVVMNKTDLLSQDQQEALAEAFPEAIQVSALRGEGLDRLWSLLERVLGKEPPSAEGLLVTNVRQQNAIAQAINSLNQAREGTDSIPHEMLLLDLYEALRSLDELTGDTTPDSILHEIFSTFCIGK